MFGLFSARCPIGPRERVWVERGIGQLVDRLGQEWLRTTPVLTMHDLSDVLSIEPVAAASIAQRFESQFPVSVTGVEWVEEADIEGNLNAQYVPGNPPTGHIPHQPSQTPELRAAYVARCLCEHALASGAVGTRPADPPYSVDLLSVLVGIGIFSANTTFASKYSHEGLAETWQHRQQPFMPSRLFGYALAVRCWLCETHTAAWANELRPDAREPFDQGIKFLRKQRPVIWDPSRDTLRTFAAAPPLDDVVERLRARSAADRINALQDVIEYRLNDSPCLHELAALTHDRCDDVREELIRTIVLLDHESADVSESLIILGDDSVPQVRSLAAMALGEITHPPTDVVETLRVLTGDAESIVSARAAESLLNFPEGLEDYRPRLFRVLRQQLTRCNYDNVDRFLRRLNKAVADPVQVIMQEFGAADDESWRHLLLHGLQSGSAAAAGTDLPDEAEVPQQSENSRLL